MCRRTSNGRRLAFLPIGEWFGSGVPGMPYPGRSITLVWCVANLGAYSAALRARLCLVSPSGMVETPRLQAKDRAAKSTQLTSLGCS
jgi:hypothetical protein